MVERIEEFEMDDRPDFTGVTWFLVVAASCHPDELVDDEFGHGGWLSGGEKEAVL